MLSAAAGELVLLQEAREGFQLSHIKLNVFLQQTKTNGLTFCFVSLQVSAPSFMRVRQKALGLKREAKIHQCQ